MYLCPTAWPKPPRCLGSEPLWPKAGKDTQFCKAPAFLTPVSEDPFYVFEDEPSAWGTLSGVKVDSHLRAGAALGLAVASGTRAAKEITSYVSGS